MENKTTFGEIYKKLHKVDLTGYTKAKQKLTYLPWASAYNLVSNIYPDFDHEIINYVHDGFEMPYYHDMDLGYMVHTKVTIEGISRQERLPVIDHSNRPLRSKPFTYETRSGKNTIQQCSMMDINKAHKRCLVKNLALFGLGIDLYIGEDVETDYIDNDVSIATINLIDNIEDLTKYWTENSKIFSKNADVIGAFAKRKKELKDT